MRYLAVFTRQLSLLLGAGMAMVPGLDLAARQVRCARWRTALEGVKGDLEEGSSLARALERRPEVFPPYYVGMVRAAERGGGLDEALGRLAAYLEGEVALRKRLRTTALYPSAVLLIALGTLLFLTWFVLPHFVQLFEGMSLMLPMPTRILVAWTRMARNPAVLVAAAALLLGGRAAMLAWQRTATGRRQLERVTLALPILGGLQRSLVTARFCRTLATLLGGGVPLLAALQLAGGACGSTAAAEGVAQAANRLRAGDGLARSLQASGILPLMALRLVAVGEETGTLDALLHRVADLYDGEVDRRLLQTLTTLLEPAMMAGLGFIVLWTAWSAFLPFFPCCCGTLG